MPAASPDQPNQNGPSSRPLVGWLLWAVSIPAGFALLYWVRQVHGLANNRMGELLRNEPVFGLMFLDFFLTAAWAVLVLWERSDPRDWRLWLALIVFCIVPTWGVALWLTLRPRPRPAPPTTEVA